MAGYSQGTEVIRLYREDLERRRKAEHTKTVYRQRIKGLLPAELFEQPPDPTKITPDFLVSLVPPAIEKARALNESGGSYAAQQGRFAVLKDFAKFAGYPGEVRIPITAKMPHPDKVSMTPDEFARLLETVPEDDVSRSGYAYHRNRAIYQLVWATGADESELVALTHSNFQREGTIYTGVHLKGKLQRRVLRLEGAVAEALRVYEVSYRNATDNTPAIEMSTFFRSGRTNQGLTSRQMRRIFEGSRKAAGLREELSLKSVRKGFIKRCAETMDPEEMAKTLGVRRENAVLWKNAMLKV